METVRLESLFSSLDECVEILAEHRKPDPVYVAAFDALKQARALVAQAFADERGGHALPIAHPDAA